MSQAYDPEFLIFELQRFYRNNNRIPKSRELNNKNGYPNWISYRTHFGSLKNALIKANLPIDTFRIRPKKYANVELITLLLKYRNEFGQFPGFSDLNKRGEVREYPHVRTYESRFGSLPNAVFLAETVEEDNEHSSITMDTLIDEVVDVNKKLRLKVSSGEGSVSDNLKLTLNEINHIIKALEGVYCRTCKNARSKLISKKKEFLK